MITKSSPIHQFATVDAVEGCFRDALDVLGGVSTLLIRDAEVLPSGEFVQTFEMYESNITPETIILSVSVSTYTIHLDVYRKGSSIARARVERNLTGDDISVFTTGGTLEIDDVWSIRAQEIVFRTAVNIAQSVKDQMSCVPA